MFEFIDVIISYTEKYPEVRASIDVIAGDAPYAYLYNVDLGVGVSVSTVEEVDKIDWKQEYIDQRSDIIQEHEEKLAILQKYGGDSDDN